MVCSSSGKAGGAHSKMRQGPPQAEAAQQRLRVSAQLPPLDASALHSLPAMQSRVYQDEMLHCKLDRLYVLCAVKQPAAKLL